MTVVVLYSDDSPGRAALSAGIQEARRRQSPIVVLNPTTGQSLVDPMYAPESRVHAVEEELAATGLDYRFEQPMGPIVADLVLAEGAASGADVIVVGLRHRTRVGKLLLGSVAQHILIEARCAVLAVKPLGDEED